MTNQDMKPGRFLRWSKARKLVGYITRNLAAGNVVVVATATKATQYDRRHADMFKATRTGAYVQSCPEWSGRN